MCGLSVQVGDQQTFRAIFWMYYDMLYSRSSKSYPLVVALPGGFHNEKLALWKN